MQYTYGQHQWHSEYAELCKHRSDESLQYIIDDCRAAMLAMPDNPKCSQYADEAHYCGMEITRRTQKTRGQ